MSLSSLVHLVDGRPMRIERSDVLGLMLFVPDVHRDERGFFTRTFDARSARHAGLDPDAFVQDSQSRSRAGVLRGLHLRANGGEAKLVRCAAGRIYDVVLDLRPDSPTYGRWESFVLDDVAHRTLHVPRGCAHGWQALSEPADVCYRIDAEHDPGEDVTISAHDPALAIPWPLPVTAASARDRAAPSLAEVLSTLSR